MKTVSSVLILCPGANDTLQVFREKNVLQNAKLGFRTKAILRVEKINLILKNQFGNDIFFIIFT